MQFASDPSRRRPCANAFILARALYGLAVVLCALVSVLPSPAQSKSQPSNHAAQPHTQAARESRPADSTLPLQVGFANGLLSVRAHGAPLSEVLRQVARSTGATLDLPPAAGADRIVASLGPAPVDQVLAALLNGSNYDYVLLNRADNPSALEAMILRPKSGPAPNGSGGQFAVAQPQPQESTAYEQQEGAQPLPSVEQNQADQNQPDQDQSPAAQSDQQPVITQPAVNPPSDASAQNSGQQDNQQPKTPEQLLEELRRMQQQQQQQQQQPGEPPQQPQSNPQQQMDAPPPQNFPQ